jgi:hypothetical protein
MYDSLVASIKTEITIKGGGHCYFANSNFNCNFGESTCSPTPTITRAQQQDATLDYTKIWLRRFLKNDCAAGSNFQDSLAASNRITYRQSISIACGSVGINENNHSELFKLQPNPADDQLFVDSKNEISKIEIFDITGKRIQTLFANHKTHVIDVKDLSSGLYFLKVSGAEGKSQTVKWIKK